MFNNTVQAVALYSDDAPFTLYNNTVQASRIGHGKWVKVKDDQYAKTCWSMNGAKLKAQAGRRSSSTKKKKVSSGELGVVVEGATRPKKYSDTRIAVAFDFDECLLWFKSAALIEIVDLVHWDLTQRPVQEKDTDANFKNIMAGCGEEIQRRKWKCGCPELVNLPGSFLEKPLWKTLCQRKLQTVQNALREKGYIMLKLLGQGSYGSVFEVKCDPSKCQGLGLDGSSKYAAKVSKSLIAGVPSNTLGNFQLLEDQLEKDINKEYDIMEDLQDDDHFFWKGKPIVLQAYDRFQAKYDLTNLRQTFSIVVMEKLKSELGPWVKDTMKVAEHATDALMQNLGGLVSRFHMAGYVHDDIKNDNVGIANDDRMVLLDFGGSKKLENVVGDEDEALRRDWYTLRATVNTLDRLYSKFHDALRFQEAYFKDVVFLE